MDLQLGGRRALVTGSSTGIGSAIARALAREGAFVVVHGRDISRAEQVACEIDDAGGKAAVAIGDLTLDEGASQVVAACISLLGGIDILIHNAGGYAAKKWLETTPQTWLRFYEQDVLSAIRLNLQFVPILQKQGWGRIIHIASGLATKPSDAMPDYAAAKAAIINASVSLSKTLAGSNVTVNAVSPGLIETDGVKRVLREMAAQQQWGDDWNAIQKRWFAEVLNARDVSRLGTPAEVADLVTYLVSERAAYITGANFRIDGGLTSSVN